MRMLKLCVFLFWFKKKCDKFIIAWIVTFCIFYIIYDIVSVYAYLFTQPPFGFAYVNVTITRLLSAVMILDLENIALK